MPEFQGDGSPEFRAAVSALMRLTPGLRSDACAAAMTDALCEINRIQHGNPTKGRTSWRRVLGARGLPKDGFLPGDDHVELLVRDGVSTYISHPYGLTTRTLREIVDACEEHGLEVVVDAVSWYYPMKTVRVAYTKREDAE